MFEDASIFNQLLVERLNYFIYVVLLLIGLWAMIAKNNLIKKLIGMSIFQTAIILFYVSIGVKEGATIPIYLPEHDPHGTHLSSESNGSILVQSPQVLDASLVTGYTNPLPHVLMLTAIVVGVATLGLALSVCLRIYRAYGTAEEDELLEKLEREDARSTTGANRQRSRRRRPARKKPVAAQSNRTESFEKRKTDRPKPKRSTRSGAKNLKAEPSPKTEKKSEKGQNKPTGRPRKPRRPREDKPR